MHNIIIHINIYIRISGVGDGIKSTTSKRPFNEQFKRQSNGNILNLISDFSVFAAGCFFTFRFLLLTIRFLFQQTYDVGFTPLLYENIASEPYENINLEYIARLMNEGYSKENVITALGISRNNIEMACDILHEFVSKSGA